MTTMLYRILCLDPQTLLTVCLVKPRVWHHTLGEIFHKVHQSGLMLVGLRVVNLDKSDAISLLPAESVTEKCEFKNDILLQTVSLTIHTLLLIQDASDSEAHVKYLCSGSSLAFCLLGENAVKRLLDILDQEDLSPWTHHHDMDHLCNGIYGQFQALHRSEYLNYAAVCFIHPQLTL